MSKCSIRGCKNPQFAKTLCSKHYRRLQRHGDANCKTPVGRPVTAGTQAALNDLPEGMSPAARARYAAAFNRKLRGQARPGDAEVLLNTGSRAREARRFLARIWGDE